MTDVPQTPTPTPDEPGGLRDMFAAAALVAVAGRVSPGPGPAQAAWRWADLMLAERETRS